MTTQDDDRKSGWLSSPVTVLGGLALVVGLLLGFYRPDRPLAHLVPGKATEPSFVMQIVRPRAGLPLGGLLPPELFGVDGRLSCSSTDGDANIRQVGPGRLEIQAAGWELLLVYDDEGRIQPETQVTFDLRFEDQPRRVRGLPGHPPVGRLSLTPLAETNEIAGRFDIELPRCEDAETGASLGWPPQPLRLHGSFDRVPAAMP